MLIKNGCMMRILIIEDEEKTRKYLAKGFESQGSKVTQTADGEAGLQLALQNDAYDIIILDLMLPKISGLTIIEILRQRGCSIPIICLTARNSVDDRVKGLEMGADDYLVKPFAFSELLARVKALLRRGKNKKDILITIADLNIDLKKRIVIRAGETISLTSKEFNLLALLASSEGEVFSRQSLMEKIWDINFDTDTNVVDVAIKRLRKKVDKPFSKPLIHTIRGIGYVLDEEER